MKKLLWAGALALTFALLPALAQAGNALVVYTTGDSMGAKALIARLPTLPEEVGVEPRPAATVAFPGKNGVAIIGVGKVTVCANPRTVQSLQAQVQAAYLAMDASMDYEAAEEGFQFAWNALACANEVVPQPLIQQVWMGWGIASALKAEALDPMGASGDRSGVVAKFTAALASGASGWPSAYAPQGGAYTAFLEAQVAFSTKPAPRVAVENKAGVAELLLNGSAMVAPLADTPFLVQWKGAGGQRQTRLAEGAGGGWHATIWSETQWVEVLVRGPESPEEHALVASTFDADQALSSALVLDPQAEAAWRWHTRAAAKPMERLTPATPPPQPEPVAAVDVAPPPKAAPKAHASAPPPKGLLAIGGQTTYWAGHAYGGPVVAFGARLHPRLELVGLVQASFTGWQGYTFALPGVGVELAGVLPLPAGRSALLLGGGGVVEVAQAPPHGAVAAAGTGHGLVALHLQSATSPAALRITLAVGGGTGGPRVGLRLALALGQP
jgi:hypothetical protein